MIKYIVQGGTKLSGSVTISGAKNAAVAILPATLLVSGPCRIENVPDISDVRLLLEILRDMGAEIHRYGRNTLEIDCSRARNATAPIAMVEQAGGYVCADAPKGGLRGGHIYLDIVSVGATMNILLAAVLCSGMTIIENCAKEPHIVDLANFLNAMGAQISGAGTDVIKVRGVRALHGGSYSIIPDQIEAGTYMAAAAAVGGDVLIENVIPKHLDCITAKLREIGADITEYDDAIRVESAYRLHRANVKTMPYPGFPTDMQPQITVCLATAVGTSLVTEGVYDNRFRYTAELGRMGANIQVEGKTAIIDGVQTLHGCEVRACDLRAGAAMVIAAMCAEGMTLIEDAHFIERGYEDIVGKLTALGAHIRRIETYETPSVSEDAG